MGCAYYDVIPIFQTAQNKLFILPLRFLHRGKISDFEHKLTTQAQSIEWDMLPKIIDFVYIATHGNYEDTVHCKAFLKYLAFPILDQEFWQARFL